MGIDNRVQVAGPQGEKCAGAGLLLPRLTGGSPDGAFLPGAVPGGSKDPGIAACEGLRDAQERLAKMATATPNPAGVDPAKVDEAFKKAPDLYRELRTRFEASRYPAIRESGTKFADASVRFFAPRDQAFTKTLTILGEQAQAYKDLSAACAEQGITIPEMFGGRAEK